MFSTDDNQDRETISTLWSRLGPGRRPTWTPNHFVPVLKKTDHELRPEPKICTRTPRAYMAKGHAITMNDESGSPVKVTEVTINHPPIFQIWMQNLMITSPMVEKEFLAIRQAISLNETFVLFC